MTKEQRLAEESRLLDLYYNGDEDRGTLELKLLGLHFGILYRIAKPYIDSGCCIEKGDLDGMAYIALLRALDYYKGNEGATFRNLLIWLFRVELTESIGIVTIPRNQKVMVYRMRRYIRDYRQRTGEEPKNIQIAQTLGISAAELKTLMLADQAMNEKRLDAPVTIDDDSFTLLDQLSDQQSPDNTAQDATESVYAEELAQALETASQSLSGTQRAILELRFIQGKTLKQTGEALHLSPEVVRNTQARSLRILRKNSTDLQRFLPDGGYRGTGFSIWEQSGASVEERYILRIEEIKGGIMKPQKGKR